MGETLFSLAFLFVLIIFSGCAEKVDKKSDETRASVAVTFEDINNLPAIEEREREAEEKSDLLALAYAYYDKINYYYISNNQDSTFLYAKKADQKLDLYRANTPKMSQEQTESYESLKKSFAFTIINYYLFTNKYDLALIYLREITEEENFKSYSSSFESQIYFFLGLTYLLSKKAEKALELFKQSYELQQQTTGAAPYSYYVTFKGMAHALLRLKRYDEMIAINDSVGRMIEEEQILLGEKDYEYYLIKYALCYETAGGYIKIGDLEEARVLLDEAQRILAENIKDTPNKLVHYQIESLYYLEKKDFKRAKEYLEMSSADMDGVYTDGIYNYLEENLQKATIMRQAGEEADAYDLLYELYELNDSVNTANFSSQVLEIESVYQVDKMKLEAARNQETLRKMFFVVVGSILITLLLIYILYSYRKNSKALKEKNRQLFIKLSELEENSKQLRELQQRNEKLHPSREEIKDSGDIIINALNDYLLTSKDFTKPNVSREELALAIGTNRQYLIEAIKEKTGKTFNEYIYSYRLKYAFELIVSDKEKKISEIYLEAGFLSNATFYRVFKEYYGMTPSELRNVS